MLAAAQRIYDRLVALGFGTTDLQTYLGGIGDIMFQEIEDLASDGPQGQAGWSSLLDINRVPNKALPWLGQFVGVQFPSGLTSADQKIRIQNTDGWKRGTPAAIAAAPLPYLGGTKTVILRERDPAAAPNDPAYGLTVITKRNETPYALKTAAAPLTVSTNEVTDAIRAANVNGDGRTVPDSSFGIWSQRANMLSNGGFEVDTAGWSNGGSTAILARDTTTYKFGAACCRITTPATTDTAVLLANPSVPGTAISQTYTFSVWLKGTPGKIVRLNISDSYTDTYSADYVLTATWTRYSLSKTWSAVTANPAILRIFTRDATGGDIYVDGMMMNLGPVALPYNEGTIPACRVRVPSSLIGGMTQFWFAMRVRAGWSNSGPLASGGQPLLVDVGDVGPTNILARLQVGGSTVEFWTKNGGVVKPAAIAAGDEYTVVCMQDASKIYVGFNGSPLVSAVAAPVGITPTALFDIGNWCGGSPYNNAMDSDAIWLASGIGILTNADSDTLYALGNAEPTKDTLPPGAMLTAVLPFNTTSFQDLSGPDPKVLAALVEQKPAGIILNYQVLAGADYEILLASNPLYSNVFANFLTYQGVINNVPGT